jgi:hypothetical protein
MGGLHGALHFSGGLLQGSILGANRNKITEHNQRLNIL